MKTAPVMGRSAGQRTGGLGIGALGRALELRAKLAVARQGKLRQSHFFEAMRRGRIGTSRFAQTERNWDEVKKNRSGWELLVCPNCRQASVMVLHIILHGDLVVPDACQTGSTKPQLHRRQRNSPNHRRQSRELNRPIASR